MTNGDANRFSAVIDSATVFCDACNWKSQWDLSSFEDFTQRRILVFLTDFSEQIIDPPLKGQKVQEHRFNAHRGGNLK